MYAANVLGSRGPRKMQVRTFKIIRFSAVNVNVLV